MGSPAFGRYHSFKYSLLRTRPQPPPLASPHQCQLTRNHRGSQHPLLHLCPIKCYSVDFSSHFHPCLASDLIILCIYKPSQFSYHRKWNTLLLCFHGDRLRLELFGSHKRSLFISYQFIDNLGEYHSLILNPPLWIPRPLHCRAPRTMFFSLSYLTSLCLSSSICATGIITVPTLWLM